MNAHSNVIHFHAPAPRPTIRRPRLLVTAARAALPGWRRRRELRAILGKEPMPEPGRNLSLLHDLEAQQNHARLSASADYDLTRHILLLAAILDESRHVRGSSAGFPISGPGKVIRAHL